MAASNVSSPFSSTLRMPPAPRPVVACISRVALSPVVFPEDLVVGMRWLLMSSVYLVNAIVWKIGEANVFKETKQYTYKDDPQYVFMDLVIDFELPIPVKLKVVDVDPGLRGGSKPVTLDAGAVVYVPLFVNFDDEVLVDKRTGQYMSRARVAAA